MKKIRFGKLYPYIDVPTPARNHIADWYIKAKRINSKEVHIKNGDSNKVAKMCVPFIDGMSAGYTAVLWQDVEVTKDPVTFSWRINQEHSIVGLTGTDITSSMAIPVPEGHSTKLFTWESPFEMITPPGYSLLVTHPINRFDLPFTTMTGIQDSDSPLPIPQAIPFFMKEDFEGIVPAGTPIFQVIPIKRENWKAVEDTEATESGKKAFFMASRVAYGWYRDNVWKKKNYE